MKYLFILLVGIFSTYKLSAQDATFILKEEEFISIVKSFHPIAKQANIQLESADAAVLKSRGSFDPNLQFGSTKKELNDLLYYNYNQVDLKIPTWYGVDIVMSSEKASGSRLDPQETPGESAAMGVQFPLLKNVLMDKRRATLKQAQIFRNQSTYIQQSTMNDLMYDAMSAYWKWVLSFHKQRIIEQAVKRAKERVDYTKETILRGDRPAIDSVEAITQWQYLLGLQTEIKSEYFASIAELSSYTWNAEGNSYDLPIAIQPEGRSSNLSSIEFETTTLDEFKNNLLNSHPDLKQYNLKLDWLGVERKLKMQELLPELNVKYNFLRKGNIVPNLNSTLLESNYQYGVAFKMPLRLSEGRAEYKSAKLKIKDIEFALALKQTELVNKLKAYYTSLTYLQDQIKLQQSINENQTTLLKGEEIKFNEGESSLFLVNSRELKQVESAQKLAETIIKYYKQQLSVRWVCGNIL